MLEHTSISSDSAERRIVRSEVEARLPLGAIVHASRYDRMCGANTIHWTHLISSPVAVYPTYVTGATNVIQYDTETIGGDLFDNTSKYFAPQTIGRYDVDVSLYMLLSTGTADGVKPSQASLWLITRAPDNSEATILLARNDNQRWYDPGTAATYNTWLRSFDLHCPLTVDHRAGYSYAIAWSFTGAAVIDYVDYMVSRCSFHYYDTKSEAYPDGAE